MNKAEIKKHGPVIKWFCDNADKGVWCKLLKDDYWVHCDGVSFELNNNYVQNDEYVEFRKAKADGKIIQFDEPMDECKWSDLPDVFDFLDDVDMYRIKPDEPEFKIGDWVISNLYLPKAIQLKHDDYHGVTKKNDEWFNSLKLWEPDAGEWCIFWYKMDSYVIRPYSEKLGKKFVDNHYKSWDNMAPLNYIQTLKNKQC